MGVILGVVGIVLTVMVVRTCQFEMITLLYQGQPAPGAVQRGYGMIAREVSFSEIPDWGNCIMYPNNEKGIIDGWWSASRFFTFLSGFLGVLGLLVLIGSICVACSPNMFEHWLVWNYIFAAIFSALGYLIFGAAFCKENECKLGQGGIQIISSFLFWISLANTVKSWPQAKPPGQPEDEEDDIYDLYYERPEDKYADPRERAAMRKYYGDDDEEDYSRIHQRMQAYDEHGNPVEQQYDDFGNPIYPERPYYDDNASQYGGSQYRGGPAGSYRGRDVGGSVAGSRRSQQQGADDRSYAGSYAGSYTGSVPGIRGSDGTGSKQGTPSPYHPPADLLDARHEEDEEPDDYLGGGGGYSDPDDGYRHEEHQPAYDSNLERPPQTLPTHDAHDPYQPEGEGNLGVGYEETDPHGVAPQHGGYPAERMPKAGDDQEGPTFA